MRKRGNDASRDGDAAALPTLPEHLQRIQDYLRGCGLLAFPGNESPLRRQLADFLEQHDAEIVATWTTTIAQGLQIESVRMSDLAQDIAVAQKRWSAHIRDPENIDTYVVLREHARGGFISKHMPSRFLASQLKMRQIIADLLRRELRGSADLPELLALLDQEFWERVLHITDFFVEGRQREVAERQREVAERNREIEDQAESYRRSVDSAPTPMLMLRADTGEVYSANQVAERELGSDVRGRTLWDLHPESERATVRELIADTLRNAQAGRRNLHLERAGRSLLPVDVRAALIEFGDHHSLQVIYIDLSERRQLEFQLIQSEKMAAIGQLAAGIAHEIRNPLAIITNALYDLGALLENPCAEVREDLQIANAEMGRAQEIISNLLEFSRDNKTEIQAVDLNALVERTLKLMNKYLQNNGVRANQVQGAVEAVDVNENGMRQVLLNLITNAVQAMPSGGELHIETKSRPHGRVRLEISDTGVGIPPERLGRIFDPFFTTKAPGEGTGLGLSMVHRVVNNAGGNIEVSSSPESGTTFIIDLPVHQPSLMLDLDDAPRHGTATGDEA
jgi:PAS domain S-box-containing protein